MSTGNAGSGEHSDEYDASNTHGLIDFRNNHVPLMGDRHMAAVHITHGGPPNAPRVS
jgi:hypothetical protein